MNGKTTARRAPAWAVWCALLLAIAPACIPAKPATGKLMSGSVTFGGAPVAGARVELRTLDWHVNPEAVVASAVADENGDFVLENPPVGEFVVIGLFPDGEQDAGGWPNVNVSPGQALTDVVVPLERALTLREPTDGERLSAAPTLRWAGFDGAARYRVLVIDAATTEALVDQVTPDTQLAVTANLTPGQTYQWVVNALAVDDALLASGNRLFTMAD